MLGRNGSHDGRGPHPEVAANVVHGISVGNYLTIHMALALQEGTLGGFEEGANLS